MYHRLKDYLVFHVDSLGVPQKKTVVLRQVSRKSKKTLQETLENIPLNRIQPLYFNPPVFMQTKILLYEPFPIIAPYPCGPSSKGLKMHIAKVENNLKETVFFGRVFDNKEEFIDWLGSALPYLHSSIHISPPDCLTITLFCQRSQVQKTESFFLNLLKKWLIPGKEINVLSFDYLDFSFQEFPDKTFFLADAKILVETPGDLQIIRQNLPILSKEIASGINSHQYAQYILETKALSYDYKPTLVHQELIKLRQKKPHYFDADIFSEMSRFLALSEKEFIQERPYRHITRLVSSHYLIRRTIHQELILAPQKRHVRIHLMQTQLQFPFGKKNIIGISIGIYLKHRHEFFDEKHILMAVQSLYSDTQAIKGSFYSYQPSQGGIRLLYLEIEKQNGTRFTLDERRLLKKRLPDELIERIQTLTPAIFMMRNEEELIRNILTLSEELQYLSDPPQVMISLQTLSSTDVTFLITLVRGLKKTSLSIRKILEHLPFGAHVALERIQTVGILRKKYPKEASVFQLKIPKDSTIVRTDSSLHYYAARQKIVKILEFAFGEFRDFNGGIILKQAESLSSFLDATETYQEIKKDFKETFFYSVSPIEMQTLLPTSVLLMLFTLLAKALSEHLFKKDCLFFESFNQDGMFFCILRFFDSALKTDIQHFIDHELTLKDVISSYTDYQGTLLMSLIYTPDTPLKKEQFIVKLKEIIENWKKQQQNNQVLNLTFSYLPKLFDPRLVTTDLSATLLSMLFCGLMRFDPSGMLQLSCASGYSISEDKKTYLFHLKEIHWSNGDLLSSYDFEYSWKHLLSPHFFSPLSYLLYPIKNARLVKECRASIDTVGIRALNDKEIEIKLEFPYPDFIKLLAYPLFFPIHRQNDKVHPNWSAQEGSAYISNGPFKITKNADSLELIKSPTYWDKEHVNLEKIHITKAHPKVAFQKFKNKHSDWLGRPMQLWDSLFLNTSEEFFTYNASGRYLFVFNTSQFPLHNTKLRRALSLSLDKEELRKFCFPIAHPLNTLSSEETSPFDPIEAKRLFQEALDELSLSSQSFPLLSILRTTGQLQDKTAHLVQSQWKEVLGITIRIETINPISLQDRLFKGDFFIAGYFLPEVSNDPLFSLYPFYSKYDKINMTRWENLTFQKILTEAMQKDPSEIRVQLLQEAEMILDHEVPFIPLFKENLCYVKRSNLRAIAHAPLGVCDFKWASIETSPETLDPFIFSKDPSPLN